MNTEHTEGAEGAEATAAEVETAPETKGASFFARNPKPAKIGIAGGLALALIVGGTAAGFAGVNAMQEQSAKDRYTSAVSDLREAISTDAGATGDLAAAFIATAESHAAGVALATTLAGLVDQKTLDEFNTAVTVLQEATDKAAAEAAVDLAAEEHLIESGSKVKVDKTPTTEFTIDQLDARTAAAEKGASAERKSAEAQIAITETLTDAIAAVDEATLALPTGLVDLALAQVDGNPSAGQAEKDAVTKAASTAADAPQAKDATAFSVSESLTAYAVAIATLKASHAAVEAQKALEAAQQSNTETYTDPSTGEVKRNPSYGGDGDSGGSDGGGWSDGGDSGGTGGIPPRPAIYYGGGQCTPGASGTSSGGLIPTGSNSTGQNWNGSYWTTSWSCPAEDIGTDW